MTNIVKASREALKRIMEGLGASAARSTLSLQETTYNAAQHTVERRWGVLIEADEPEDFDELLSGTFRDAFEADPSLEGLAIDLVVARAKGPLRTTDTTFVEWTVVLLQED